MVYFTCTFAFFCCCSKTLELSSSELSNCSICYTFKTRLKTFLFASA